MIRVIRDKSWNALAIVTVREAPIKSEVYSPIIDFITGPKETVQLAYMARPKGEIIPKHSHNPIKREIIGTREVVVVIQGSVKATIYNDREEEVANLVITTGDAIVFLQGGHSFEMLEDTELYEVKQGPYLGAERDKKYF